MFYDKQPEKMKQDYKNMLQILGSLSKIFSESDVPYLYYRAHENIFSKYFNLTNNSRSDDSADAYSVKEKVGIGLKTWVGQNNQKVAEFGKLRPQYKDLTGIELIQRIAEYRNTRIRTTMNTHGLDTMLYHIVKRIPKAMQIYEAAFDYIDIANIVLDEKRGNDNSTYFSDGKHTYHFSLSKNTLYMIFDDMELLDEIDVEIIDDPFELLSTIMSTAQTSITDIPTDSETKLPSSKEIIEVVQNSFTPKQQLCLRLYSTKADGTKFVAPKSGLNQWNGERTQYKTDSITGKKIKMGSKKRNPNELYIPYPSDDRERGAFFPPRDTSFDLLLPDGQWISAKVCQEASKNPELQHEGKAIMSNPNKVLGKWLLRDVFELPEDTVITYEMLQVFGIDSVMFTKLSDLKYSIDFCALGTYETFYNIEANDDNENID